MDKMMTHDPRVVAKLEEMDRALEGVMSDRGLPGGASGGLADGDDIE